MVHHKVVEQCFKAFHLNVQFKNVKFTYLFHSKDDERVSTTKEPLELL